MARTLYQGVSELAKVSRHRLDDARALLNATHWRGSMYLTGYAIECLLKTKLMRMYGCRTLTDLEDELRVRNALPANASIFSHHIEFLMGLTKAPPRLRQGREVWADFNTVNRRVPAWRYSADLADYDTASDFFGAVERLAKWVEHNI
jgi:hypothetical protein